MAPRRNSSITESATKESREATIKSKKAIQETNGKLTRRKDKTKKEGEHGEQQKGEEKRRKKKQREKREGKGKRQGCPGGTMLITRVSTGGMHHDDDSHTSYQVPVTWYV